MQTETIDKNQQATPSIDEELIDTLIAISVLYAIPADAFLLY